MRHYNYHVILTGYQTIVSALNKNEAIILSQAEAIKNASNYTLVKVVKLD